MLRNGHGSGPGPDGDGRRWPVRSDLNSLSNLRCRCRVRAGLGGGFRPQPGPRAPGLRVGPPECQWAIVRQI